MRFSDLRNSWFLHRAARLISEGRLRAAAECLTRWKPGDRSESRVWQLRGRLMNAAGRPLEAVACLTRATRLLGTSIDAIFELAHALMSARDFDLAERVLRVVLRADPIDRRAVMLLAHVFRAQGRFETAFNVIKSFRPRRAASKYAKTAAPRPLHDGHTERQWAAVLERHDKSDAHWRHPSSMAKDPESRDDLICFFDELARSPGGRRDLAAGVSLALPADESWLIRYVRIAKDHLKMRIPRHLPEFLARYGARTDKPLLMAGLAEGGPSRALSARALVALGWTEFDEVLVEMQGAVRPEPRTDPLAVVPDPLLGV